jgi:Spy/CpxP family protein refolding chaperone
MKAGWKAVRKRLGPVGLSLAAAAITAAGFAAFSVAADDEDKDGSRDERAFGVAGPGPGGPGIMLRAEGLSEEDQQKLENFRQCMEDQDLPAPPRFREGEEPPEPPSREELEQLRDQLEAAHEACKGELPEKLRDLPPPPFGHGPCGPPPGLRGDREDDDGANEEQSFELPAPAPSGTS